MTAYPPPEWLTAFVEAVPSLGGHRFSRFLPPPEGGRRSSAVLVLFAPGVEPDRPEETSVVITERAHSMRSHAGQPAFPGGGTEEQDANAVGTALREAEEEVGLDPTSVEVLADLPTLHIPVSGYDVTPVLGWWRDPAPQSLWARDRREVARVVQPSVSWLVDPRNRFLVRHPSGFVGPAWDVDGLLVWGFTAGVLDRILDLAGIAQDWDRSVVRELSI
ncbi:CoA pyrophosphatase [Ornithinimicrobium humiphilum]|uniref:NUDIX domain-containing protein n=1 Tax=Ornithinimicrobium humiphilum TaxID=125288 RepID=A0A543KKE0_9MICO|nr:CoA pyrophosphatase [Ornithinimicrobium humiphilum]TQM95514.1 NUDIX domain-containing protein [Ornithinimicrobium humiphilum]